MSSFATREPLSLPFELQRSEPFLALVAGGTTVCVGAAIGLDPRFGLALILVIAVAFAVAMNEKLGLGLLVALVPITSGIARGLPAPGIRVSEAITGLVGVMLLVSARRRVRWTALDWTALLYATATFAMGGYDLLQRGEPFTQEFLGQLSGPFQFLLLYRAIAVSATTPERRRFALRLLLLASVPVALLALGQQFGVPGVREFLAHITGTDIFGSDGTRTVRATGPFPHWHNLGGYLLVLILVNVAVLIRRVDRVLPRWALIAIVAVDSLALLATVSIAPIACAIAGTLILGVWFGGLGRMVLALAVGALVAGLLFAPTFEARYDEQFQRAPGTQRSGIVPQTVQYRYELWTGQLLPELKGRWITGYGPDLPPSVANFPYTESLYLGLLFRGGLVLLVSWALLTAAMMWSGYRSTWDRDPLQQALGASFVTALFVLLFIQVFQAYFFDAGNPHALWVLAGLLAFRELDEVPAYGPRAELAAVRRAAAARRVWAALETFVPGSRALLQLSYRHHVPDEEVVGVVGVDMHTMRNWRAAALARMATLTRLPEGQVRHILEESG